MTEKIGETSIAFTRIFLVQNKMKVSKENSIQSILRFHEIFAEQEKVMKSVLWFHAILAENKEKKYVCM